MVNQHATSSIKEKNQPKTNDVVLCGRGAMCMCPPSSAPSSDALDSDACVLCECFATVVSFRVYNLQNFDISACGAYPVHTTHPHE